MKTVAILIIACFAAASLPASAQPMYQWKDPATGRMIYSDNPPPPGIKPLVKKEGAEAGDERQQSYATRLAAERFPVLLYTSADCLEHCANARNLLNGRGVPFSEKLVQGNSPDLVNELRALTGGESVVLVMRVGSQHYKGFEASAWNNLLDLAGYPKSAPYGSKQSGAFAK